MREPHFELFDQPTPVAVHDDEAAASLTSGGLTVRVAKGDDWRVDFLDGDKLITSSGSHGMGCVDTPEGRFVHEQLNLGVGECVYGLGERFTPFVKNGQVVDIWNEDGGTSSELAYKNIPFYMTNRGYGVFVNHPERVSFEVGFGEGASACSSACPASRWTTSSSTGRRPRKCWNATPR